jgi:hypothetical protein
MARVIAREQSSSSEFLTLASLPLLTQCIILGELGQQVIYTDWLLLLYYLCFISFGSVMIVNSDIPTPDECHSQSLV